MFLLNTPSSNAAEAATPGSGRGGVGGGAPTRYTLGARGRMAFSTWHDETYKYSIQQLYMTTNPTSNLEVVSLLNVLSQATSMYYTYAASDYPNYTPKLYLGTFQTTSSYWILDSNTTPKLTWPQAFQKPQKGEANK